MTSAEEKKVTENINTINQIGNNDLGSNVKKRMENNMKGAILGGGLGIVLGIAMRKNLIVSGMIGLIIGRLILVKK